MDLTPGSSQGQKRSEEPTLTADDCEQIFHACLEADDVRGVHAALTLMAVRDPRRAQLLLDTTRAGLAIAQRRDGDA